MRTRSSSDDDDDDDDLVLVFLEQERKPSKREQAIYALLEGLAQHFHL